MRAPVRLSGLVSAWQLGYVEATGLWGGCSRTEWQIDADLADPLVLKSFRRAGGVYAV